MHKFWLLKFDPFLLWNIHKCAVTANMGTSFSISVYSLGEAMFVLQESPHPRVKYSSYWLVISFCFNFGIKIRLQDFGFFSYKWRLRPLLLMFLGESSSPPLRSNLPQNPADVSGYFQTALFCILHFKICCTWITEVSHSILLPYLPAFIYCCSVTKSCPNLHDPMGHSRPALHPPGPPLPPTVCPNSC